MKRITLLLLVFLNAACGQNTSTETTTYYLIRHAEKDLSDPKNPNPDLTEAGIARSVKWQKMLSHIDFDAVYSTDFVRTRKTATPIAESEKLPLIIYDHKNLDYAKFIKETQGQTVLIVGHSNSTPKFVNWFLGYDKYEEIDEKQYGYLFIVKRVGEIYSTTLLEIN
ncbi:MAG: phosphoglycerate mutase [Bacteroidetes bacterium HGW-Bacteroidetes-13]|jgi:broad specificity phosphatase PhoE|nr:MAG: phosphoglycerate mutase [Bacteroidetes bacterium HGW-Bacteroidetes-13]